MRSRIMDPRDLSRMTATIQQAFDRASPIDADGQRHLLAVKAQIEAIARGDIDALLERATSDVQLDIYAPPELEWIRHARGTTELRRAIETNFGSVEDQQPEITSVTVQGDTVVLLGREHGRIKRTGETYAVEFVQKFQFRGEQLAAVTLTAARLI
jgi:ketosteroid isomerase-like protein